MTTYEELGMVKTNESVIPADCLSFAEQAMYVAEYAQEEYNNLFEAVGIEELAVFEATGMEMVYEGAKLDAFKDKAKKFFQRIWAAIKAAYEKVYAFFIQKSKKAMESIKGLTGADVEKVIKANPDKDDYGTTHDFDALTSIYNSHLGEGMKMINEINGEFDDLDKLDKEKSAEIVEKTKEKFLDRIFGSYINGAKNLSDIRDGLKKDLKEVKVSKAVLKSHFDDYLKTVKDGKDISKLKETYQAQKKLIDEAIKKVSGIKEENMRSASTRVMLFGKVANVVDVYANTYFDIMKKKFTEYLLILVRVWKLSKKVKDDKKKTNESVEYTSYSADMVAEAFNW